MKDNKPKKHCKNLSIDVVKKLVKKSCIIDYGAGWKRLQDTRRSSQQPQPGTNIQGEMPTGKWRAS